MNAAPSVDLRVGPLGRRFVSEDGRLDLDIRRCDAPTNLRDGFPLAVEAGEADGSTRFVSAAPARFLPRADEDATSASARLDRVQVELGIPSAGPTYTLMLARPTSDRSRWHGYDWVALR